MAQGQPDSRVRKYIGIDSDDEAILAWWDAQKKPSASIRDLIVEAIEKRGVSDYHFRNVEQLPRRGRPPQTEAEAEQSQRQSVEPPRLVTTQPVAESHAAPAVSAVPSVPAPVVEPESFFPEPVAPEVVPQPVRVRARARIESIGDHIAVAEPVASEPPVSTFDASKLMDTI